MHNAQDQQHRPWGSNQNEFRERFHRFAERCAQLPEPLPR
jgi:hypothetical protein